MRFGKFIIILMKIFFYCLSMSIFNLSLQHFSEPPVACQSFMPIVSLTEVSRQLWINWGLNGPPPHSHVWTPRLYWCHSVLALVSQPQPWPLIGECQSRPVTINYTWRCPWPKTNPGLATEAFRLFGTKPITRKTNDPSYSNCDSGIDLDSWQQWKAWLALMSSSNKL